MGGADKSRVEASSTAKQTPEQLDLTGVVDIVRGDAASGPSVDWLQRHPRLGTP